MTTHRFSAINALLCSGLAAFSLPAFTYSGSGFAAAAGDSPPGTQSSSQDAPSYNTDPGFGALPNEDFTTPEADARPGVYYFQLATRAFEKKQYQFAINMYQVAASWAYKPAEYNLGVMYYRGQGIPVNRPLGAAWMVLAAERNTPQYVQARNLMVTPLSNAEFAKVNTLWKQLKPTYGDEVALHRAKVRWAYVRSHMTGSRVGGTSGPLRVGSNSGAPSNGASASTPGAALNRMDTSGFEMTGGHDIDGTVAYQQFRQSDNPYDPKFKYQPVGTTSIGPLTPVKKPQSDPAAGKSDSGTPPHL